MNKTIKKIIPYILILIIFVGFFGLTTNVTNAEPMERVRVERPAGPAGPAGPANPTPAPTSYPTPDPKYYLLAPLPCVEDSFEGCKEGKLISFDPSNNKDGTKTALGNYLNLMIKIFIGICAVLAMGMIILGGLEYMTSELVSSKESGKQKITGALLGLVLALGSWAILNTINPSLLNSDVKIEGVTVKVPLDDQNFSKTEQTVASSGKGYKLNGAPSSGVSDFVNNRLAKGEQLRAIAIDTKTGKAYFYTGAEGDWSKSVAVPINVGLKGVAAAGQAQVGDFKTPIGVTNITSNQRAKGNNAIISGDGVYNLGAAFINIGIKDSKGNDRHIGFHGSSNNALGTTNGCVRMSNDDLVALGPYMRAGVQVIIK